MFLQIAREIDVHSKLSHPHVVKLHTYFEDDSNVYIILENCPLKVCTATCTLFWRTVLSR